MHLAISLAIAAAQSGRRVYYGTPPDLITSLEEAQAASRLQVRLKVLTHLSLLTVDEIGYLPISRTGAMLFVQLMTRRYDHASTVLTSNTGFEEWGDVFGDDVIADALIDRLIHHCHLVTIRGNSYRLRQHTELWPALHDAAGSRRPCAPATGRPSGGDDGVGLVPSPICQIFTRRNCQSFKPALTALVADARQAVHSPCDRRGAASSLRQRNHESRASVCRRSDLDAAAVRRHNGPRDEQAQPAVVARTSG